MNTLKSPETYDQIVSLSIDLQNDFFPGGRLGVENGDQVIDPINNVNDYVRSQGGIVIFTRDWHPKETSHFNTHGGPWPPHCIAHRAGAAFHDDLNIDIEGGDLIASKGMLPDRDDYSGLMAIVDGFEIWTGRDYSRNIRVSEFLSYGLAHVKAERVKKNRVERLAVLVGGLATEYCDKATVLGALELRKTARIDMDVYVIEDAMRAVNINPSDGQDAIDEMVAAGAMLIQSADITSGNAIRVRQ